MECVWEGARWNLDWNFWGVVNQGMMNVVVVEYSWLYEKGIYRTRSNEVEGNCNSVLNYNILVQYHTILLPLE
jgi:hypothetical protein